MLKQLENPIAEKVKEAAPVQNDKVGLDKAADARAFLARMEERKQKEAEETQRRLRAEIEGINRAMQGRPRGGYCGCG